LCISGFFLVFDVVVCVHVCRTNVACVTPVSYFTRLVRQQESVLEPNFCSQSLMRFGGCHCLQMVVCILPPLVLLAAAGILVTVRSSHPASAPLSASTSISTLTCEFFLALTVVASLAWQIIRVWNRFDMDDNGAQRRRRSHLTPFL
jgi:hypothetical protein